MPLVELQSTRDRAGRRQSPGSLLQSPADTGGAPADTDSATKRQSLPPYKAGIIFGWNGEGLSEKRTAQSLSAQKPTRCLPNREYRSWLGHTRVAMRAGNRDGAA